VLNRIGIDTGGTFTDFVSLGAGEGRVHKVLSTPQDPLRAIVTGLNDLRPQGLAGVEVVHGTTVGTNAFLTRQGAKVALLTTQGFEDVLFIGRQTRRELFNLAVDKAPELLPRERVIGVKERLGPDGRVLSPLTADEIERVRRRLMELAPEAVAICLLHAYGYPEHEERLAEAVAGLKVPVSLSSRVLPEFREYERTCATVLNAYLGPILERYLTSWQERLPGVPLFIQQSNGGFLPGAQAAAWGIHTVLSGPAGGVYGAWRLGQELGEQDMLTLDMGGTSTDVAAVPGEIPFTREYSLEDFPLGIPVIDIHTVGAGGGSIAFKDRGGALRVGPRSAGAHPGPVCYGRGREITVTDAQLLLGRIRPECFLGGRLPLDLKATQEAMAQLATQFGVGPEELALGIIKVVSHNMAKALQAVTLERGLDPRDFTLCCFGGAGGLHICELARDLEVRRILVPAQAGVLSAMGMALAGHRRDFAHTLLLKGPELRWSRLQEEFADLKSRGLAELAVDGLDPALMVAAGELELRYPGQGYTLTAPLSPDFREEFHRRHKRLYGHAFPDREVEAVVLRLNLSQPPSHTRVPVLAPMARRGFSLPKEGKVWLDGGPVSVPLYYRPDLKSGMAVSGPALVLEDHATLLVAAGFEAEVLEGGLLRLRW
jgi:N-methylhydantoinase A/oxoprolinase/acetone carboxylase beta subunit